MILIDLEKLSNIGNQAFSGRPLGKEFREKAGLDQKDGDGFTYTVRIPEGTGTFTPSFFGGLFEDSIVRLGRDGFRQKYHFIGEPYDGIIERGIADALIRGPVAAY
jgi:hypothetical protein